LYSGLAGLLLCAQWAGDNDCQWWPPLAQWRGALQQGSAANASSVTLSADA